MGGGGGGDLFQARSNAGGLIERGGSFYLSEDDGINCS